MRMLPNRQRRRGILAAVMLCVCFISGVAFAQTDAPFTEDMLVEAATPKAPVTALDALMIAVIALASCALLYTIYNWCLDRKEPLRRPKRVLWLLLGGALLLRLVLAAISPAIRWISTALRAGAMPWLKTGFPSSIPQECSPTIRPDICMSCG